MPPRRQNSSDPRRDIGPSLEAMSDEELMRRVRDENDATAFAVIVERFRGELGRYLRHYLHNADSADDVLQIVLLRAYRHRDQYHSDRRLRPWLYGMAMHSAIDWLRAESRLDEQSLDRPPASSGESEPGERRLWELVAVESREAGRAVEAGERRALLRKAIRKLPDRLRSVVVLVCLLGMKQRDAAETLDVPLGTVKSRVHEAVRKLRQEFGASGNPGM